MYLVDPKIYEATIDCVRDKIEKDRLEKLNSDIQDPNLKFHLKLALVVQLTHHPYQRECLTFVNLVL